MSYFVLEALLKRLYFSAILLISGSIYYSYANTDDDSVKVLPELDFSFSDTFTTTFSIKTAGPDTVYLKQDLPSNDPELRPDMKSKIDKAKVKKLNKSSLASLISTRCLLRKHLVIQ